MYRGGYIYILTNQAKTVLYVGVTSDLKKRLFQHRDAVFPNSFSSRYNTKDLIYYEGFDNITEAIAREKQIKKWSRSKKAKLIFLKNPEWNNLFTEILNDVYSLL